VALISARDASPTLLLGFNFPPHGGGIARMMGELALRYPRPLVVSTGSYAGSAASDAQWPHTVDRVAVPAERLRTIQGLVRWTAHASALARRCRPGFAWCAELKPAAYPARWLRARHGIPYGVITYGAELLLLDQKIRRSRVRRWTARSLLADAAVFVAISVWTAAYTRRVLAELGLAALGERVRVVPLGTDPQRFRPGLDTAVVRRRYGFDGSPWILTVARLDWHKGFDTVIRALPAVRVAHPDVRYAIAGTGAARPYLEQLVRELRLEEAVRFLGPVPEGDLPAVYNAADLFVLASRRHDLLVEGFGIAVAEASACGLAVVGGREAGLPDAVREGETGVLVDPYDPAAVAAAVIGLLDDAALRRRLGEGGRRAVETYYNWDRVVRDLAAIDRELRYTRV